jgi:hypothetical protein
MKSYILRKKEKKNRGPVLRSLTLVVSYFSLLFAAKKWGEAVVSGDILFAFIRCICYNLERESRPFVNTPQNPILIPCTHVPRSSSFVVVEERVHQWLGNP